MANSSLHGTLQNFRMALRLVGQASGRWTAANVALVVTQGLLPIATLVLTKIVIDTIAQGIQSGNQTEAFRQALLYIVVMGFVAMVGAVCRALASYVSDAQALMVTDHVQSILHSKSIEVDLEYYESTHYYDKLHRAQQEAPYRPTRIVNGLVQLGQSAIALVAIAGLLFAFHWSVAAVLFAASIPGALIRIKYADTMYRWRRKRTQTERRASYLHTMLTGEHYAKELRLFGLGGTFVRRFTTIRKQLRNERLAITKRRAMLEMITHASALLAVYGAYAFLAYHAIHSTITLGDVVMYFQAFQRGQAYISELLNSIASLYEDNLFLASLTEFLALTPRVVSPREAMPVPNPIGSGITFDGVTFRYAGSNRPALRDVSFTIRPGEHVAIVGDNGAGKTTLIKLLCRLYDPTEGTIQVDGTDIRQFDLDALRETISIVFQDFVRYHLSARENLALGKIEQLTDEEMIVAAARKSGADAVIASLPDGYNTMLGKLFEDGAELSTGEWQKIALGRAFLRDAQIIVLDEPTSALDPLAEAEVFQHFHRLAEGRTALLISHRLSTVKMADRILVMREGSIIESGTHDELMLHNGAYAELFETQARNYR